MQHMDIVTLLRKRGALLGDSFDGMLMKAAANAIEGSHIETAIYQIGFDRVTREFGADYDDYLNEARQKIVLP